VTYPVPSNTYNYQQPYISKKMENGCKVNTEARGIDE
jgi:hypothetical protein